MLKIDMKKNTVSIILLLTFLLNSPLQAGWFEDNWNDIKESIFGIKNTLQDQLAKDINDNNYTETNIINILQENVEKIEVSEFISALIFINNKINDKDKIFNLFVTLMEKENLITDDIFIEMLYSSKIMNVIDKSLKGGQGNPLAKTRTFFNASVEKFVELISVDVDEGFNILSSDSPLLTISTPKIPVIAIETFGNLGSVDDNNDALEESWETFFRLIMGNPHSAKAFFKILSGKDAMLKFMIF